MKITKRKNIVKKIRHPNESYYIDKMISNVSNEIWYKLGVQMFIGIDSDLWWDIGSEMMKSINSDLFFMGFPTQHYLICKNH